MRDEHKASGLYTIHATVNLPLCTYNTHMGLIARKLVFGNARPAKAKYNQFCSLMCPSETWIYMNWQMYNSFNDDPIRSENNNDADHTSRTCVILFSRHKTSHKNVDAAILQTKQYYPCCDVVSCSSIVLEWHFAAQCNIVNSVSAHRWSNVESTLIRHRFNAACLLETMALTRMTNQISKYSFNKLLGL